MVKLKPLNGIPEDVWKSMTADERSKVRRIVYRDRRREKKLKYMKVYNARHDIKERKRNFMKTYYKREDVKERERKRNQIRRPKNLEYFRKYNARLDSHLNSHGPRYAGTKTLEQFCYCLMKSIHGHLKVLKCSENEYTIEKLIEIAKTHDKFIIDEYRSFDLRYTNGFFNSASIQRWNEHIGYTFANTTPIPIMLQSRRSFSIEQLRAIPLIIQRHTTDEIINEWREALCLNTFGLFRTRAGSMFNSKTKLNRCDFGFDSIYDAASFLRSKFIECGGLCGYSGVPMRLTPGTRGFVMSVERVNPIHGYTPDNIILICYGLNGPVFGQHTWFRANDNGSEAHQRAVDLAKFNLPYWRQSMKYTDDDLAKIEETRTRNRELMKTWPILEIKPRTKREPQVKRARVDWDLDSVDDFA